MRRTILTRVLVFTALTTLATLTSTALAKTLVFCSEANPAGFQPALYVDGATFDASARTIYDRLVDFRPGTAEIVPALARSWEISPDGRQYTFHLRPGVQFQSNAAFKPSRAFNADDVVFTFERMRDPKHPYHAVSGGTYTYFDSMEFGKLIRSVEKLDAMTVRFNLTAPSAPFLADLTMDFASIASAEYAARLQQQHHMQDFDLKPIGTGPFALVSYQPGSQIRYSAFAAYWDGKPKIDTLVFAITPDASVRWAKLRAGECQIMSYPNPSDLSAMHHTPGIQVMHKPGLNIAYLAYNMERKPLGDPRVRRALTMAIDRAALVRAVHAGNGTVAEGPIPPTLWSYDTQEGPIAFDPAGARKLLAQAGYPQGFDTDLWAFTVSRPYLPDARRAAVMIQSDWARIGVRARIVTYEWAEYLKRIGQGEHATALYGWSGDNGDPDNFLATLLSCGGVHTAQNAAEFCDKPYQALIEQAQRTSDQAARARLYVQAQKIFRAQMPWAPLAHANIEVPMSTRVRGYVIPVVDVHVFTHVDLD